MNILHRMSLIGYFFLFFNLLQAQEIADPVGPLPSQRQLNWQEMEYYAFIHFNMNTFTNREWGEGGELPEQFNPTELDVRQWAKVAKEAGMKGIIITAKHHDGFCLWPSETTEHSVKNSPWKNGEGDLVKELAKACEEFDLGFGVYLSPWDRNHVEYGREEYVKVFHRQLEELMTNYGPLFEVWFDGANGGTGYYGGANENRKIDHRSYYQWDKVYSIIRKHQPDAVIFGDNGPDIRWIGNEEGVAGKTNWSLIRKAEVYAGSGKPKELQYGHADGTHWVPGEADVSIRPGWYYHPQEDHLVKSLPHLLDIYYGSVGRNASLLLNIPVDRRGLIHENDIKQLMKLREKLDEDFENDLAQNIEVSASKVRNNDLKFSAKNTVDGNKETYWSPGKNEIKSSLTLDFGKDVVFNRFLVQEYIPLGQRVKSFTIEGLVNGEWHEIDRQTTIGYKRILRFDPIKASALRLNILDSKASPLISNIEVYNAPALLVAPEVARSKKGVITLQVPDENVHIYYTLDGTEPNQDSYRYKGGIDGEEPVTVKAVAYDPLSGRYSELRTVNFDIPKTNWKVISATSGDTKEVFKIIDEDKSTWWASTKNEELPQEVVIDLGRDYLLKGFTYHPSQDRWSFGTISDYIFEVSKDNQNWDQVASGEFGNIRNNPIEQKVGFEPVEARYIKLKGVRSTDNSGAISIGELSVITVNQQ
ncbi:alpha-L-fucosidase [Salinimicrobium sp. TIG7-5_MAKvit]